MKEFLGLRTAVYPVKHLAAAKDWYTKVIGAPPYFDEPYYVGFSVAGYELGLLPDESAGADRVPCGTAYWGVLDADAAYERLIGLGAAPFEPIADHGVKIGAVRDPFGNVFGIIENPHFKADPA